MPLSRIAYLCAILPIVTVHVCWLIAASAGNLEWCNPYWSHCHSISATGRKYPEFFVFKGLMIPAAVAMLAYWWCLKYWITQLYGKVKYSTAVCVLGSISAIALLVYTVTLGAEGEKFALARRTGVVMFFALTYMAHLLLIKILSLNSERQSFLLPSLKKLTVLSVLLLVIGAGSSLAAYVWDGYQYWDNAFEWWFALLMMGQHMLLANMWSVTNFRLTLNLDATRTKNTNI